MVKCILCQLFGVANEFCANYVKNLGWIRFRDLQFIISSDERGELNGMSSNQIKIYWLGQSNFQQRFYSEDGDSSLEYVVFRKCILNGSLAIYGSKQLATHNKWHIYWPKTLNMFNLHPNSIQSRDIW